MTQFLLPLMFIALIIILFLPAIFELKRPKDAGPRRIVNMGSASFTMSKAKPNFLLDLEDIEKGEFTEERFERVKLPVRNPIFALFNIEV